MANRVGKYFAIVGVAAELFASSPSRGAHSPAAATALSDKSGVVSIQVPPDERTLPEIPTDVPVARATAVPPPPNQLFAAYRDAYPDEAVPTGIIQYSDKALPVMLWRKPDGTKISMSAVSLRELAGRLLRRVHENLQDGNADSAGAALGISQLVLSDMTRLGVAQVLPGYQFDPYAKILAANQMPLSVQPMPASGGLGFDGSIVTYKTGPAYLIGFTCSADGSADLNAGIATYTQRELADKFVALLQKPDLSAAERQQVAAIGIKGLLPFAVETEIAAQGRAALAAEQDLPGRLYDLLTPKQAYAAYQSFQNVAQSLAGLGAPLLRLASKAGPMSKHRPS